MAPYFVRPSYLPPRLPVPIAALTLAIRAPLFARYAREPEPGSTTRRFEGVPTASLPPPVPKRDEPEGAPTIVDARPVGEPIAAPSDNELLPRMSRRLAVRNKAGWRARLIWSASRSSRAAPRCDAARVGHVAAPRKLGPRLAAGASFESSETPGRFAPRMEGPKSGSARTNGLAS